MNRLINKLNSAMIVAVQDAAVEVELVALSVNAELMPDNQDTLAMIEAWYVSLYGSSTYEQKEAMAADAHLNNPTKWPDIRAATGGVFNAAPQVNSKSPYEAWVANAADYAIYWQNGHVSWYGNYYEPVPLRETIEERATPLVHAIFWRALYDVIFG